MVDLARLLELDDTNVQVFVLDSHRPYNLRNVYHKQVWLIDDGTTEETDLPPLEDMLNDPAFDEDEEDDEEEDEEEEDERDYEEEGAQYEERERLREYRKRMRSRRRLTKEISRPPRTQVEKEYYEREAMKGLSYGASVAGLLLEMASVVYQNGIDLR